jgi:hypothetical protein
MLFEGGGNHILRSCNQSSKKTFRLLDVHRLAPSRRFRKFLRRSNSGSVNGSCWVNVSGTSVDVPDNRLPYILDWPAFFDPGTGRPCKSRTHPHLFQSKFAL